MHLPPRVTNHNPIAPPLSPPTEEEGAESKVNIYTAEDQASFFQSDYDPEEHDLEDRVDTHSDGRQEPM